MGPNEGIYLLSIYIYFILNTYLKTKTKLIIIIRNLLNTHIILNFQKPGLKLLSTSNIKQT